MFKRANKMTALLVAAAAVVSLVPATGANAAAKRLGNKEGTVKEGIAYDGGKYSYYGYRTDDDETGIYYNKGGDATDKKSSDLEDYRFDTLSKYGTKYAYAHEQSNTDQYLVDLTTGEIVSDETKEEKQANAKTDLLTNLKRADRYNGTDDLKEGDVTFNQILQGQFGEIWYQYQTAGHKTTTTTDHGASGATITVPVLSKAQFDAKMNAASVATGFTTTVLGESYTFVANGSTGDQVAAKKLAISNDGATTPGAVDPSTLTGFTTSVSTNTVFTIGATGVSYNGAVYNPSAFPVKAGTLRTSIDSILGSYDSYLKSQVTAGVLVRNGSAGTAAKSSDGTSTYDFTTTATASQKAAVQAKFLEYQEKLNKATIDANAAFDSATNTSGSTLGSSYTEYINFVNTTIANKIADAGTAYTNNFTGTPSLSATSTTDQAKTSITIVANTDGPLDSTADATKLANVFGSAFQNGGTAGSDSTTTTDTIYTGFSNEDGKYIDASYTANLRIFSQTKGRAVIVENYDETNKDAQLTAHLEKLEAIAQDKDNIYAIATVKVTGAGAVQETQYFLQKISKAQGDKEQKAYLPKSVTSYQLDAGIYDEDDMQKPLKILKGEAAEDADTHPYLLGIAVKDGEMYVTRASKDNVKVYKFDLKTSYKKDVVLGSNLKTDVDTAAVVYKDASDEDVFDFDVKDAAEDEGIKGITAVKAANDSESEDIKLFGQTLYRHPSVSIDVNGNTWAVKKTKITKFDGIDKKSDIYTVDGAMDAIDVYDDNSLIAWDTDDNSDSGRYTTVKEGTAVTEGDGINVNPDINKDKFKNGYDATEKKFYKDGKVVTNDWACDSNGKWYLLDANGTALTGWQQKGGVGHWYLFGADGTMLTGWQQSGGNWFYLNPISDGTQGAMLTGWQQVGGSWFYLNPTSDGTQGAMKTGWQYINGKWYYLNPVSDGTRGVMLANTTVNGYTLGSDGAMI